MLLSGCRGGEPSGHLQKVDWDLSRSHTIADVRWYDASADDLQLRPIGALRIRLSGGRELRIENGPIQYVYLSRSEGDQLEELEVHSYPLRYDNAYRLALRLCRQWGFSTEGIENWYAQAGAPADPINGFGGGGCSEPGQPVGRERPAIDIGVMEFEANVVYVTFTMYWHADDALDEANREAAQERAREPSSAERRLIVQAVVSSKLTAAIPPESYYVRNIRKALVRTPGSRYARLSLVPRPGHATSAADGIVRLRHGRWQLLELASSGSEIGCDLPRLVQDEIGYGLC